MVWRTGWHLVPFPHGLKMCLVVEKDPRAETPAKFPLNSPEGIWPCADVLCGKNEKDVWVLRQNTNSVPNRVVSLRLMPKVTWREWETGQEVHVRPESKFSLRSLYCVNIKLISLDNSSDLTLIQFVMVSFWQTPSTALPRSGLFHVCTSVLRPVAESKLHIHVLGYWESTIFFFINLGCTLF